ncbi:hypothetical protein [Bartonella rattaustraliani]
MKSCDIYKTLGETILLIIHKTMESFILDRRVAHLKEK